MSYAVIATGGKQYKVETGKTYRVEKLPVQGKTVTFDQVLLLVDRDQVQVGTPHIPGLTVTADVVEAAEKGEKLRIFKYKAKSRYRKTRGHRQTSTVVKITAIGTVKTAKKTK